MTSPEKAKSKRLRMVENGGEPPRSEEPRPQKASDQVSCPRCFGTGMEVVPGEGARRCDCQTISQHERLFQNARIPARYRHCTLANYEAGASEAMWIAKREAQIVLDDFLIIDGRG